ncbi:MAG: acylneuraminate cytidylyltransferase family protein [Oscillospiraceae bacterium]|nr:acylneuraminate cytidylyltransferase family protein [Oscillospiraceae bacterium]
MKKVLITICGRAGSKGFRNKNLKTFLEKPLVYYTLASAFNFKETVEDAQVDVCLNTDSQDLADLVLAKYPEVNFIPRPEELGGDVVPKMAVFQQSLNYMEEKQGVKYDYLIDLDITSPLRQIHDVLGAYKMKLEREDAGLVFSGCPSRRNPYFNMVKEVEDHVEKVIESPFTARQQAPAIYDLNASIYVFETEFLRTNKTGILWETKCLLYPMRDTAVLDIDSEEDFEMMQLIGSYLFTKVDGFKAVRDSIRD